MTGSPTSRSVPEWIGASPDAAIPARVRVRVFERHGGICYRTGRKIRAGDKWQVDHIVAIINGGENRESNLAPILDDAHKAKTAEDVKIKAKTARLKKAHLGIREPSRMPGSKNSKIKRKLSGQVVDRATGEPIGGFRHDR
ncbi:5-methylcytosine-specific restriction endonuclease McrA [Pseudochelatococcus lubricantis]|uniref:5-methylcytosine-specific restriction endonuclease McrA n=1 Tax=Pseudochelatococcus lubricantis TaxID=1538102 RepID=A0ABX0UW40_9HYPH|nr:HNH endonuclease [Pseudochelatococcus lubricantis]NIJ57176.1 5-methylcytosine-specific restriction endonuclease McrA [Pseudochelatococcus lubricantis]